jgi:Malectin domain
VFDLQLEATIVAGVDVLARAGGLSKVAVIVAAAAVVNDDSLTIQLQPKAPKRADPFVSALYVNRLGPPPPLVAPVTQPPAKAPTKAPTISTSAPITAPTKTPVTAHIDPTKAPVPTAPKTAPVNLPTKAPVMLPTKAPTKAPTKLPTKLPTEAPTMAPVKPPTEPVFQPIRINCGGYASNYNDSQGQVWLTDRYSVGTTNPYSVTNNISGTNDPILYQSERWGSGSMNYSIPVPLGTYTVILHFAEI